YPLHLGITATGSFLNGIVKSSIGLGGLLSKGIGNIIRVSLTAPSYWEIRIAKHILQALALRKREPEIISCPTCSRCEVDLIKIVDRFNEVLQKTHLEKPLRVAIMGCVVNGPGEARQADIGVAFGKKKAVIFKKDKIIKQTDEKNIITDLFKEVARL
ncbi:MAG: flavodoxin-dependent (E)-4-hydroxy-3-methylbut-2-enyl-diphosphate synthase, partial [Candidatus Omnitrophota bacterium]